MSWWSKAFGSTKTEELPLKTQPDRDWKLKYKKVRAKYEKMLAERLLVADSVDKILKEKALLEFLLFATAIQCGGVLEISSETVDLAGKMQVDHEATFKEENGTVTYNIKRRESKKQNNVEGPK